MEDPFEKIRDPYCRLKVKYIHLHPEFHAIESGSAPTIDEMNSILQRGVPLHVVLPDLFEIVLAEPHTYFEQLHEESIKEYQQNSTKVDLSDIVNKPSDIDFSMFPPSIINELKTLHANTTQNNQSRPKIVPASATTKQTTSKQHDVNSVKVDVAVETKSGKDDSVQSYVCSNKKRLSEMLNKSKEKLNNDVWNKSEGETACSLNSWDSSVVPLNDGLKKLNLQLSDTPIINNDTKPFRSTNPFHVDYNKSFSTSPDLNKNTNPFLANVTNQESKVSKDDFFKIFGKTGSDLDKTKETMCRCRSSESVNLNSSCSLSPIDPITNPFADTSSPRNSSSMSVTDSGISAASFQNKNKTIHNRVRTPPGFTSFNRNSSPNNLNLPFVPGRNTFGRSPLPQIPLYYNNANFAMNTPQFIPPQYNWPANPMFNNNIFSGQNMASMFDPRVFNQFSQLYQNRRFF